VSSGGSGNAAALPAEAVKSQDTGKGTEIQAAS
jgi:hypothetical protein